MTHIPSNDERYPSGYHAEGYGEYYAHETLGPKCPECESYDTRCLNEDCDEWLCERCGHEWLEVIPF